MNSNSFPTLEPHISGSSGANYLSIALVCADEQRRTAAAIALAGCEGALVQEYSFYPSSPSEMLALLQPGHDVIMIDLDGDCEYAIELIERICADSTATVMAYSEVTNSDLLVSCMRAGAREFLVLPLSHDTVEQALVRASARRSSARPVRKEIGKLLVFLGAKGGVGVTTIACNYAVALAQIASQSTLLIDLHLPLGDAVLNLGLVPDYSTFNALQDFDRLDSSLLAKLVVKHGSGLSVLAAPGKFSYSQVCHEATDKLLAVARRDFDNVVIDIGSRLDLVETSLFKDAFTIYLVTQAGIAELRNSNRLISQLFSSGGPRLETVVNRYEARSLVVNDDQIVKALTRPINWKIPNDHAAVRKMQSTATPLVLTDSPISRQIRRMADSLTPQAKMPAKKKGFRLFG